MGRLAEPVIILLFSFIVCCIVPMGRIFIISLCNATQILRLIQTIIAFTFVFFVDVLFSNVSLNLKLTCFKRCSLPTTASLLAHLQSVLFFG